MARSKTPKDLRASILAGSEETFDFVCQPCSSEQHLEAVGYCQDCSQYMCVTCIKYHGKLAGTANHTVLDKSAMPKTKIPQKVQNIDVLTEKCPKHPDKVLEYSCETHDKICCSVCVTLEHISCSDKNYIPDISGGIAKGHTYRKLKAEIDRLVGEITKRQERINNGGKNNERYCAEALDDIKVFRKQINDLLDEMEADTKRKVLVFHKRNVGIIAAASQQCQSLLSEVNSMAANMDTSATAGKHNQLFVQVKLFGNRIAEVDREMNDNKEYKITRYAFYQDEKLQQMMSTLSAIWSLSVRQDDPPTKARYVREVNVKAEVDREECLITGITVLTNDRVVVSDSNNTNVKLIDMKANKVVSHLSVSSMPLDITDIKPNQIAVALGDEEKIAIITVTNTLSLSQTIETPGVGYSGLCYNGSHFIAACAGIACIKIIDMSGKALKTISTGNNGEKLFTLPRGIALSRDKDVIYITDIEANTMTSMSLSGDVISVYRPDTLKYPLGIAVGQDGAVYLCSTRTDNVHQLTPTGDLTRVILTKDQGLAKGPGIIAYDDKDERLYTSSLTKKHELQNYLRLYQLE